MYTTTCTTIIFFIFRARPFSARTRHTLERCAVLARRNEHRARRAKELKQKKVKAKTSVKGVCTRSPFLRVQGFNIPTQMAIDAMHLVDLGVARRIYSQVFAGSSKPAKCLKSKLDELATSTKVPREYPRRGRAYSKDYSRMKAAEWSHHGLVLAPAIAEDIIPTSTLK